MTESPATYNPGYEDTEFAKRAKAAKVRVANAKLEHQGVTMEDVLEVLEDMAKEREEGKA